MLAVMKNKINYKQYRDFLVAGILATFAQYATLYFLVDELLVSKLLASVIGYIVGGLVNYLINYYITFNSSKRHRDSLINFIMVVTIGLVLNTLIFTIMLKQLALYYLLAQIIASIIVLFWNYWAHKKWTF